MPNVKEIPKFFMEMQYFLSVVSQELEKAQMKGAKATSRVLAFELKFTKRHYN